MFNFLLHVARTDFVDRNALHVEGTLYTSTATFYIKTETFYMQRNALTCWKIFSTCRLLHVSSRRVEDSVDAVLENCVITTDDSGRRYVVLSDENVFIGERDSLEVCCRPKPSH